MSEILQLAVLFVLTVGSCGMLVYWGIGLHRLVQMTRTLPTARDGIAMANTNPPTASVCAIVPAHNEADKIGVLIESLKNQDYPRVSFVLTLDRCTDATGEVARAAIGADDRFEIIEIDTCPDDWAGKVNALHRGVRDSRSARDADYLLFTDADTRFDPACVRATLALAEHRGLDLLSLLSSLDSRRWYEIIVQPAAAVEIGYQFPLLRANADVDRRAFANGQFMLFKREGYESFGGHESVKDALLEDLALAERMGQLSMSVGVFMADGMLTCRMYDSWEKFRKGWKRIYTETAKRQAQRLARWSLRKRAVGTILPLASVVNVGLSMLILVAGGGTLMSVSAIVAGSVSLLAICVFLSALILLHRLGCMPMIGVPAYALGSWLVGGILSEAASDLRKGTPVSWGGRTYPSASR